MILEIFCVMIWKFFTHQCSIEYVLFTGGYVVSICNSAHAYTIFVVLGTPLHAIWNKQSTTIDVDLVSYNVIINMLGRELKIEI